MRTAGVWRPPAARAASSGSGSAASTVSLNSLTITASEKIVSAQAPAKAPIPIAVTSNLPHIRSGTARTMLMTTRLNQNVGAFGLVSFDIANPTGSARAALR